MKVSEQNENCSHEKDRDGKTQTEDNYIRS